MKVEHRCNIQRMVTEKIPCSCADKHDYALKRVICEWQEICERGEIQDYPKLIYFETALWDEDYEIDEEVFLCSIYLGTESEESIFEIEEEEWEVDEDSHRWTVRCFLCDTELEPNSNWSEPDTLQVEYFRYFTYSINGLLFPPWVRV